MSAVFKQIIKNIGNLTADERTLVARCLIYLLEIKHDDHVDDAWSELAEKRFMELESGSVRGVSWNEIRVR